MNIKNLVLIIIFAGVTGSLFAMNADKKPFTKEEFILMISEGKSFGSVLDPRHRIVWDNEKKYKITSCEWTSVNKEKKM